MIPSASVSGGGAATATGLGPSSASLSSAELTFGALGKATALSVIRTLPKPVTAAWRAGVVAAAAADKEEEGEEEEAVVVADDSPERGILEP